MLPNFLVSLILKCLIYLPNWLMNSLSLLLTVIIIRCKTKTWQIIKTNIEVCFRHHNKQQIKQLIDQACYENALTMMQIPAIWAHPQPFKRFNCIKVHGWDQFSKDPSQFNNSIFVSPHIGNWELLTHWFSENNISLLTMYTKNPIKPLEQMMRYGRTRFNQRLAPANIKGVRAMMQELKKGGTCGILPDQFPGKDGGVLAPFFGIPTHTMTLISKLTNKTNATIIFIFAIRSNVSDYSIHLRRCDELSSSNQALNELEFATILNRNIEDIVLACPQQYLWSYKRFRDCDGIKYPTKKRVFL